MRRQPGWFPEASAEAVSLPPSFLPSSLLFLNCGMRPLCAGHYVRCWEYIRDYSRPSPYSQRTFSLRCEMALNKYIVTNCYKRRGEEQGAERENNRDGI